MKRLVPLLWLALAVFPAACATAGPPRAPPGIPAEHLHFAEPAVHEGDVAPDFSLARTDGRGNVSLADFGGRPIVLVFGSYT